MKLFLISTTQGAYLRYAPNMREAKEMFELQYPFHMITSIVDLGSTAVE